MALYGLINVLLRQRKQSYLAPETNAEQSKTNIPIKPNIRSVSNVYAKLKLGSGSTKRLVKQSKWQSLIGKPLFCASKLVFFLIQNCQFFVVSLPFFSRQKKIPLLEFH
jgi:hypothetical protein